MTEQQPAYTRAHASIDNFINAWKASGGAERANYQLFLSELCDQLNVPRPEPTKTDDSDNAYVFERTVTFPFPNCTEQQKTNIRELAESLDAHRKRQQEQHQDLTMTGMYNVLTKLRSGEELTVKEKTIHEQGLVSVLKQLHDDLDAAVADAYGWLVDLPDEEILQRLVNLNKERSKEEENGLVRWLRPEYQNPQGTQPQTQGKLLETEKVKAPTTKQKMVWPKTLPEQVAAVRNQLAQQDDPVTAAQVKDNFKHAREPKVLEILVTLASIGQAREIEGGRFVS